MTRIRTGAAAAFVATCMASSSSSFAVMVPTSFFDAVGKEFSDNIDRNSDGDVSNGQSVAFASDGTTVNGFAYPGGLQVDAMSNKYDPYYHGIFSGTSALLLGTAGDTTFANGDKYSVMAVTPGGTVSGWATPKDFFATGAYDVDSLDVSGLDGTPDAELFSYDGELNGVAIWDFNGGSPTAWMTTAELDAAVGLTGLGVSADLDAMIVNGDDMIFSINKILGHYDGGELFVYRRGSGVAATILQFGGQTWNTAFDSGIFLGCKGHVSETDIISAVQMVPEPGTIAALSAGALALLRRRRK